MFQNPDWIWLEILVLSAVVVFLGAMIGTYAYKRAHHIPTGDCAACHINTKRMLKEYHKKYGKH